MYCITFALIHYFTYFPTYSIDQLTVSEDSQRKHLLLSLLILRAESGVNGRMKRSGTSDDVECFFSVMRDTIGRDFTVKQVKYGFRIVCNEFMKRLDSDLPFYYHTSSHTRFYEGPLIEFDKPKSKEKRKGWHIPRREQSAAFAPRRATMPVRGSVSTRVKFRNLPIELPPPPGEPPSDDHMY